MAIVPGRSQSRDGRTHHRVLDALEEAAQVCYEGLQTTAMENAIDIFMVQPVGRHYEQLWIEGYNNNPAYQGNWFYPLSKWLLG